MYMIVGIHQPNYLPYLGFLDKMKKSDIFIIYDDAQFNKSDFQHRNRIRIYDGSKWLTVPVEKKHKPLNEVRIQNDVSIKDQKWSDHHLVQIYDNYKKANQFGTYFPDICEIYKGHYNLLVNLNMELITFLSKSFDIDTKIVYSSEYPSASQSTQRIIELVQAVGADTYLSGPAGKDYMDLGMFEAAGIEVLFQEFEHPVYKQQYEGFVPYMSSLDALLNGYRFD
jgi:hypothetical protein